MRSINYALLFLGCLLFHLVGTWSVPLIDRDEPRFAEASREMMESGDYIVPHFNNQLRLDKPPLAYWAQVASYRIFGENDFAARFPSAIAAALIALSILAWGRRIGGDGVGWWAAIIFTLSLQTFIHAKAAVADMWLVLFVTIAHWAGYELIQRPTPNVQRPTRNSEGIHQTSNIKHQTFGFWLMFYLALAFGFLAKGPIAWTPLLTLVTVKLFARDVELGKRFKFMRGVILMLALVAMWGIPALIRTRGQFLIVGIGRHVVGRSFGAMEGHGANSLGLYLLLLPFYFVTIFVSFLPWSIKLPWLMRKLWPRPGAGIADPGYSRDRIDNYLLAGVGIIFVIFTLSKTKLPHYTLPAFPLLSLLLARHWSWPVQAGRAHRSLLKAIVIVTVCLWLAIALVVPPLIAPSFPAYALFQKSRDYLRPEMEFGSVDYQEPSLIWYFRSRLTGWMTPLGAANASQFMERNGPRFVILPTGLVPQIFPNLSSGWKMFSTRGFNIAKGKRVDLTLILKPE